MCLGLITLRFLPSSSKEEELSSEVLTNFSLCNSLLKSICSQANSSLNNTQVNFSHFCLLHHFPKNSDIFSVVSQFSKLSHTSSHHFFLRPHNHQQKWQKQVPDKRSNVESSLLLHSSLFSHSSIPQSQQLTIGPLGNWEFRVSRFKQTQLYSKCILTWHNVQIWTSERTCWLKQGGECTLSASTEDTRLSFPQQENSRSEHPYASLSFSNTTHISRTNDLEDSSFPPPLPKVHLLDMNDQLLRCYPTALTN